jgi:transposase-like protein
LLSGGTTAEVCRGYGIREQTFYRWKANLNDRFGVHELPVKAYE